MIAEAPSSAERRSPELAVAAYQASEAPQRRVDDVEIVKSTRKTRVFRIRLAGGSSVIVKAAGSANRTEQRFYERVLAGTDVAPRWLGTWEGPLSDVSWLVLEDVGGAAYEVVVADHRRAGARWLARLHRVSPDARIIAELPVRDLAFFRSEVADAANRLARPAGPGADAILAPAASDARDRLLALLDGWEAITGSCRGLAPVIVHGDLAPKNLAFRAGGELVAVDWRGAGWGTPAIDLAQHVPWSAAPDPVVYAALTRRRQGEIRRIAAVGGVLRAALAIGWAAWDVAEHPRSRVAAELEVLVEGLKRARNEVLAT